jgi:hydrogenase expression/formation protein HypC
MKRIFKDKE